MSREKTALFLADCLSNMPKQLDEVKVVIAILKRIAQGGEWSRDEARAASSKAADAAAITSAEAAARSAAWAVTADRVAACAALAHPDPDKERARQNEKRKELGI